jgi:hypothetical protein
MVKVIVIVMLLAGAAVCIAYFVGGARSFDPTEQGRQAQAAIKPGMTWQQVVDAAGKPVSFQTILEKTARGVTTYQRGATVKFDPASLPSEMANKVHAHGFVFIYNFSAQSRFSVEFDGDGVAQSVQNEPTVADLLDTRKK